MLYFQISIDIKQPRPMGSSHAKQSNKSAQDINTIKENVKTARVEQIRKKRETINATNSNNSVVLYNADTLVDNMLPSTLNTAEQQMKRGGSNLTKSDLIAIIVALDPQRASQMYQLNVLKINDLNFIIRSIIYDMRRYETPEPNEPSAPPYVEAHLLHDDTYNEQSNTNSMQVYHEYPQPNYIDKKYIPNHMTR